MALAIIASIQTHPSRKGYIWVLTAHTDYGIICAHYRNTWSGPVPDRSHSDDRTCDHTGAV